MKKTSILRTLGVWGTIAALCIGMVVPVVAVGFVTLDETDITLALNETQTLTASVDNTNPSKFPLGTVFWSSYDTTVATVSTSGVVTAIAEGTTTITATSDDDPSEQATCRVTVVKPAATGVTLSIQTEQILSAGDTLSLTATVAPAQADQQVIWKSSDTAIATVDATGVVTAVAAGKANITAKAGNAESNPCPITVSGIVLDTNREQVYAGAKINITYTLYGAASGETVVWNTNAPVVATVVGGSVTTGTFGDAIITASAGTYIDECYVTVMENRAQVIEGTLNSARVLPLADVRNKLSSCCIDITGNPLSYITSINVPTAQGIVYFDYKNANDTGTGAASAGKYYDNKTASTLQKLTFVPNADFDGTAKITYTGYDTAGKSFSGTIEVRVQAVDDVEYSVKSGEPLRFSGRDFSNACVQRTGRSLKSLRFELPSTSRGTLYYNYLGDGQYSSKVSASNTYGYTTSPSIDLVTFLPASGYTGTLRINYHAENTSGEIYSGKLTINVTKGNKQTAAGDVNYKGRKGEVIFFKATDFNTACRDAIGETLSYVKFDLPSTSQGTLYLDYKSSSNTGTKVTASKKYYRTQNPLISDVSFVTKSNASDVVYISFTGYGTSGDEFEGEICIDLDGAKDGTVTFRTNKNKAVDLSDTQFDTLSKDVNGARIDYITFDELPTTTQGTLYYNYSSNGNYDSKVTTTRKYYRASSSYIGNITFVPKTGYSGTVRLDFTGRDVDGMHLEGEVRIIVDDNGGADEIFYTISSKGRAVFDPDDFDKLSQQINDARLSYIRFDELPSSTRGTLYYNYTDTSTGSSVKTATKYYRSSANYIEKVTFVPKKDYVGTVSIDFTGYDIHGDSFQATVTIKVTEPTIQPIKLNTGGMPLELAPEQFHAVARGYTGRDVSYIQLKSLPTAQEGTLFAAYNGFGENTLADMSTRYYPNKSPSIGTLCFLPRAGCNALVRIPYLATDTKGDSFTGYIEISVVPSTQSTRFSDMGRHGWAAAAVDFLYQKGVVSGTGASTFGPTQSVRRCDFVVMLCKAFGFDTSASSSFSDVPSESYYASAVAAAQKLAITAGDNGKFYPERSLTRQDAMVMLHKALLAARGSVAQPNLTNLNGFSDAQSIAPYAKNAMSVMVGMGALSGNENKRLNPAGTITRAEMAVVLHQILTQ